MYCTTVKKPAKNHHHDTSFHHFLGSVSQRRQAAPPFVLLRTTQSTKAGESIGTVDPKVSVPTKRDSETTEITLTFILAVQKDTANKPAVVSSPCDLSKPSCRRRRPPMMSNPWRRSLANPWRRSLVLSFWRQTITRRHGCWQVPRRFAAA